MLFLSNKINAIIKNFFKYSYIIAIIWISGCVSHQKIAYEYPAIYLKGLKPHYVCISNGQIEYYRFGHGTPLILIPGYATDVSSWNQDFLKALADKHQLIVINNRNVGGSIVHSSHYESKALAKDIYQLSKKLKLKQANILGISMGGMIAQQLVVDYPNEFHSLILINTMIAGKQAVHPNEKVKNKLIHIPKNKVGLYVTAIQLFFPSSQRVEMAYSLAVNRFKPETYNEINPEAVLSQQQNLIKQWTEDNKTADKLSRLHIPTLILNGKADQVIPPINSIILAVNIPHAQLEYWQEGGHAMIYQYPEQIANAINNFLSSSR